MFQQLIRLQCQTIQPSWSRLPLTVTLVFHRMFIVLASYKQWIINTGISGCSVSSASLHVTLSQYCALIDCLVRESKNYNSQVRLVSEGNDNIILHSFHNQYSHGGIAMICTAGRAVTVHCLLQTLLQHCIWAGRCDAAVCWGTKGTEQQLKEQG